jgi:uncharacterized membrane protein
LTSISKPAQRFDFIDRFRGFVGVLMLLGHTSYYFNSLWKQLDPFDPLFPDFGQFLLRYAGYLCAPGFLIMAGAMVWWSYNRRIQKGHSHRDSQWHLIQRGLFLILVQITWVNSSWGGFARLNLWHLGIIACIGISMIFLTFIINTPWYFRVLIAMIILLTHPLLLQIAYNPEIVWQEALFQTFIDSGNFNKYPVLPWLALAILGSVMANGWLRIWKTDKQRILMGFLIAAASLLLAFFVRLGRGFGNILPFSDPFSISFFIDHKYPPSLFMNLWFFGLVILGVTIFIVIGKISPRILKVFSIPGKVPLFFYGVHLAILGIFTRLFPDLYRRGEVSVALLALGIMLIVMLPLCKWFFRYKRKSKNYIIQMI